MYFYVDESGQTGKNLFDDAQPVLFYGLLSSPCDLNETVRPFVEKMRHSLGVERLHAAELGNAGLARIASQLHTIQRKNRFHFDFFTIRKLDHALICFFDQVFDQGVNKAVPYAWYWTPLRFPLLFQLARLFDLSLTKKAWEARNSLSSERANIALVEICETLLRRLHIIDDPRGREILSDALRWAKQFPDEIQYNVHARNASDQISPNLIAFQSVLHGIYSRLEGSQAVASSIVVDRQSQFNKAQEWLADLYRDARGQVLPGGMGLPGMNLMHVPDIPITCTPGTENVGLELVDMYLWTIKRILEKKPVASELRELIATREHDIRTNEVSLKALHNRWMPYLNRLPMPSPEKLRLANEISAMDEVKRRKHVDGLPPVTRFGGSR